MFKHHMYGLYLAIEAEKVMKLLVVFATLFAVIHVYAIPVREKARTAFQPIVLSKAVGDIWSDCSQPGDKAKINSVTITPDPPVKGQEVEVKAIFTLDEKVTGGSIKVAVKYGFIPIYSGTLDLCDEFSKVGLKCPLSQGNHTIDLKETIPNDVPHGHYTGEATVTDQNEDQLACVKLDIHL